MANSLYMAGRQKYARPQAILLANNPGVLEDGKIVPQGTEFEDFIILSDDNRQPLSFSIDRIETRKRMVNGRQRSYHVADKVKLSTSWDMLPSRSFAADPAFNNQGQTSVSNSGRYTSDGGAGGVDLLRWYEENTGSFWAYLAYDSYDNFAEDKFDKLNQYNEVVEVFFSDFSYSVEKRGGSTHDYWNISLELEEV